MKRLLRTICLASLVLALALIGLAGCGSSQPTSDAARTADASVKALVPDTSSGPTLFAQAREARLAIRAGHFAAAHKALQDVLKRSHVGRWHFAPFAQFVYYVAAPADSAFAKRLDHWVQAKPHDPLPRLVRAAHHYQQGWWIRGGGFVGQIQPAHLRLSEQQMQLARRDIAAVLKQTPDNPFAWYLRLSIGRGESDSRMRPFFAQAIARFPHYYSLYAMRLSALQPKWGGSVAAMKQFVQRYADPTANSPLKMLHVQLYADLLEFASQRCWRVNVHIRTACMRAAVAQFIGPATTNAAKDAIRLFAAPGKADATRKLMTILTDMITTGDASLWAGRMVQVDAAARHSATQIALGPGDTTDYGVDQLLALIWHRRGNFRNALTFERRAIKALAHAHFANKSEARMARAQIYHGFVDIYHKQQKYRQAARYGQAAAILVGGYGAVPGMSHLTCEALFRLKRYKQALAACTDIVRTSGDLQARYFRARVYEATHQDGKARADYRVVAGSEADLQFSTYAATELSVMYDKQHKPAAALKVLQRYHVLFEQGDASDSTKAVYYNNRCYDKMKLGQLKAALHDCNISLRYGTLPDAQSKRRKLLKKLKKAGAGKHQMGTLAHA